MSPDEIAVSAAIKIMDRAQAEEDARLEAALREERWARGWAMRRLIRESVKRAEAEEEAP